MKTDPVEFGSGNDVKTVQSCSRASDPAESVTARDFETHVRGAGRWRALILRSVLAV